MQNFIEISREDAKSKYCKCERVWVTTNAREYWKLPAIYEYGSHAPACELFHRSIPDNEGEVKFFAAETRKRRWICHYINSRGNEQQKIFNDMEEGLAFTQLLDKRIERKTCGGYSFTEI